MERLSEIKNKIGLLWSSLLRWQKVTLVGIVSLVFFGLIALVVLSGRESWEPLFSGLEIQDEASIVAYLKENKIPYRLDPGANAILLPEEHVYEVRLELARAGLPKGGVKGYEIFDDVQMGMSEFQQKITYVRALEGELARTVAQIDSVEYAKINIVIPQPHLFLEQQQPATASVLVRINQGASINPEQIKAIVHLVSHSVEGLQPDDVTVVDTDGNVLSDLIEDDMFIYSDGAGRTVSSVQRELERQQEKEMERKVRAMLERVFGPGSVVVRIKVDLDLDKKRNASTQYIPGPTGKGVVRSEQNTEESYVGPGGPTGGAPGTTTNIPGYAIDTGAGGVGEYNKMDTVTNYEITTHESENVETPGSIRRLTASVLVDGDLSEEQLEDIRALVAPAIGLDSGRGDQIAIQSMKFSTTLADRMAEQLAAERRQKIVATVTLLGILLIILALALFMWYRRRRRRKSLDAAKRAEDAGQVPSLQDLLSSPGSMEAQGELAVLEEQIRNYALNNPEEFAAFIREWIVED
ncbi:MAG: flagellar basal-body MS-ring/collar protein FliF [Synergistota bacterium]|nr:flagellar basal-body MS-ring/collar protein FliF [Synergistota bacterium]